MKYLVLIYTNAEARRLWEQLPEDQQAAGLRAYAELNEELAASGEMIVSESLADSSLARHVVVRDGQPMATDGPFAEVKEQLAGFYLVDCDSIERATEIAGRIPEAQAGHVEVRPVRTYSGLEM
ncbi:YciI family protein [Amycolatopsis suaedae]|uniref:YciI family protein n=1 Tax=Amycolatopsis suaedae TaxID=2510978 RepID=A0A4Q7J8F8_9PSEU|nr:YciI family protein [Amycolatopsis suaedae]RZQ62384.1 YciI family protein [Amycolatopsis suaedae]